MLANKEKNLAISVCLTKNDLECPVCFEQFELNDHLPITLPCGHDVCSKCLNNLSRTPKCPKCRAEFPANLQFKPSVHLQEILRKISITTGNSSTNEKGPTCSKHIKEIEYVCVTEKKLLCRDCVFFENHADHQKETFKNMYKKTKEISDLRNKVEKNCESFIEEVQMIIENRRLNLLDGLDKKFASYMEMLRKEQVKLRNEIESYFNSLKSKMDPSILKTSVKILQSDIHPSTQIDFNVFQMSNAVKAQAEVWADMDNIREKIQKVEDFINQASLNFNNNIAAEIKSITFSAETSLVSLQNAIFDEKAFLSLNSVDPYKVYEPESRPPQEEDEGHHHIQNIERSDRYISNALTDTYNESTHVYVQTEHYYGSNSSAKKGRRSASRRSVGSTEERTYPSEASSARMKRQYRDKQVVTPRKADPVDDGIVDPRVKTIIEEFYRRNSNCSVENNNYSLSLTNDQENMSIISNRGLKGQAQQNNVDSIPKESGLDSGIPFQLYSSNIPVLAGKNGSTVLDNTMIQSFINRFGDWKCPTSSCGSINYSRRIKCALCGTNRPDYDSNQNQSQPQVEEKYDSISKVLETQKEELETSMCDETKHIQRLKFEDIPVEFRKSQSVKERPPSLGNLDFKPDLNNIGPKNSKHQRILEQVSKVLGGISPSKIDSAEMIESFCLDDNGYVFDDEGNHVLDQYGGKLKLTSEQIKVFQPYEVRE